MLVNGTWQDNWKPVENEDDEGRFIRQTSSFRNWVTPNGEAGPSGAGGFKAEANRYHLYVAYICPWACRTLMARQLKGLTDIISVSVVNPVLTDQGWKFGGMEGSDDDKLNGAHYFHELYTKADSNFTGRATVPAIWDKHTQTIVNNESADILRMLNSAFSEFCQGSIDLYPSDLRKDIDELNVFLYENLNNGVYQAGFATSQSAYEEGYERVFKALDKMEDRLSDGRQFLFGDTFTESDIRLFVTLVRFDTAYQGVFKCNRNRIIDMPYLHRYMHTILDLEGTKETVNMEHIKRGYYSIKALNPNGIVPRGPSSI